MGGCFEANLRVKSALVSSDREAWMLVQNMFLEVTLVFIATCAVQADELGLFPTLELHMLD